ncbi:MAG TPA: nicotinate (nicotinamide) nucleotide adenylyltransferase [Thermoanaerobaculia bacterium]|jgi:nicotinate-nucleotide adenylyltransferase|nr:nicotinate (nicotinamide) nucleotide adenylyltransferase [Thermoanaerobaculia bacterium]
MRVGLFGGSFDPIHAGHVAPVRAARAALELDRVFFLPTAHPPHKSGRNFAPALARFAMVELALLGEEGMFVSTHELGAEPAYTVETLEHFHAELPAVDLHLILGSDSLAQLPSWRRWREIPKLARLVVLTRPGSEPPLNNGSLAPELRAAFDDGRIVAVEHEPIDLSATALRAILARGEEPPAGSLHPLVLDYARKYRLYDETPAR